ncbi:MAG: right-handed parallel beta-helix repeat-containing protein [Phormidesmis sp.]
MSKPLWQYLKLSLPKSLFLLVSGAFLAWPGSAIATEQTIDALIAKGGSSVEDPLRTPAVLLSQTTPISSVASAVWPSNSHSVVKPDQLFIHNRAESSSKPVPVGLRPAQTSVAQGAVEDSMPPAEVSASAQELEIPARFGASVTTSSAGFDEILGVNAFVPLVQTEGEDITFLEGAVQLIEDEPSVSLSVGHRRYDPSDNVVRGGYIGMDSRATDGATFYQVAAGYEQMNEDVDFRVNGYLPIGDRTHTIQNIDTDTVIQSGSGFQGNQLVLSAVRERQRILQQENSLGGFDAEIGTELTRWDDGALRGYVGGYWLSGKESSLGGQLRLAADFASNFNAGLALQHDALFDTSVVFSISASFPGRGSGSRDAADQEIPIHLADPITRRSSVAVNVIEESEMFVESDVAALQNPEEEADYRFIHVDLAQGAGAGAGTFESPFGTVESAIALINSDAATYSDGNTIVYVDGESAPTAAIPGFAIPERVRVLSQGPEQIIAGMPFPGFPTTATRLPFAAEQNFNVSGGDANATGVAVSLPESNDGVFPVITGGAADLVTLGESTVLAGFQIQNADNHGVTASEVNNVELRNNLIENAGGSGIFLDNVGGSAILLANQINNAADRGILVQNTQTARPLEIAIAGFELNNNRVGMEFLAQASSLESPIQSISVSPDAGINTSLGTPTGVPLANSIRNSTDEGIVIQATGDSLFRSATQEILLSGVRVESSGLTSGAAGVRLLSEIGAHTQEFNMSDNSVITSGGGNGLEVISGRPVASGGSIQSVGAQEIVVRDSTISSNAGNGIDVTFADSGAQELVIRGNQIINNTGDGIRSLAQNTAIQEWRTEAETGDAGISENIIRGNDGQAIVVELEDSAELPIFSAIDNDLSDNGAGPDIEITSTSAPDSNAAACLIIADNLAPLGIQLTGADPVLTGGMESVLVQDLLTLQNDLSVTFFAVDAMGDRTLSDAPFINEANRCIP